MRNGSVLAALACLLLAVSLWYEFRPSPKAPLSAPGTTKEVGATGASDETLKTETRPNQPSTLSASTHDAPARPTQPAINAAPPSRVQSAAGNSRKITSNVEPRTPGVSAPAVSPLPSERAEISPEEVALDVDKITLSLRDYRTVIHENPVGTNAEITSALNGGNPRQARLLPDGQSINAVGEMMDRWGTPYFFHQLSKDHMEVRSAGPDRTMWTPDDTISN